MAVDLPPPLPVDLEVCVAQASESYGVAPELIQAVMFHESSYRVDVVVKREKFHALGLMQINTQWWLEPLKDFEITYETLITEPCTNVAVGTWILRRFYLRHGNWFDALAAYNAGHSYEYRKNGFGYAETVIASWQALYDQENSVYVATSQ
jgi:soluble lytic murein transglycosylase-like protein